MKFFYEVIWLPVGEADDCTESVRLNTGAVIVDEQALYDQNGSGIRVVVRHMQEDDQ